MHMVLGYAVCQGMVFKAIVALGCLAGETFLRMHLSAKAQSTKRVEAPMHHEPTSRVTFTEPCRCQPRHKLRYSGIPRFG